MIEVTCPGLPAAWMNAWMAAVGATVLSPDLRLHWTREGSPRAVLSAHSDDPAVVLLSAWPSRDEIKKMPIRRKQWEGTEPLPRNIPVAAFRSRVAAARSNALSWTLTSTMTDLHVDEKGNVAHGPLDPPVPRGLVMHDRLLRLPDKPEIGNLRRTLDGTGERVLGNGLGFDIARMGSEGDSASKWIDPVVETLAFFGLALFPVRGTGTDEGLRRGVRPSTIQRGWVVEHERGAQPQFHWPAWGTPLDRMGIDALLDLWRVDRMDTWSAIGIHAGWHTVTYKARGTSDTTRGFGAQRLA